MKRSFIREILEHTTNKTISFAGGLPDERLFPNKQLQASAVRVLEDKKNLQYTKSTGIDTLKEKIAKIYTNDGFDTRASNIMITSGSQQALDIISRFHYEETITVESPSYLGAMNLFTLNKLKQSAIVLESDGINIDKFENSFKQTKLTYLIPDYQNPTGISYTSSKREKISKIVKEHGGIIIEDAPYTELYFEEKNVSISKNLPKNSFHLGSFSKTLAPSLRIGWIRADESLLNPLIPYKEAMDLHTNGLSQYILDDYLNDMQEYEKHLHKLRKEYHAKMLVFKKYLEIYLPSFKYVEPKGGMFIYGELEDIDTSKFVIECLKHDVVFVPGIEFYTNDLIKNQIRFNFTHSTPSDIIEGLLVIKKILLSFKREVL